MGVISIQMVGDLETWDDLTKGASTKTGDLELNLGGRQNGDGKP